MKWVKSWNANISKFLSYGFGEIIWLPLNISYRNLHFITPAKFEPNPRDYNESPKL
jgi:hypothetical protein